MTSERHIDDLLEVISELLAVPELRCIEPDELFDHTREVMAKACVIRAGVLDELAAFEPAPDAFLSDDPPEMRP